MPQRRLTSLVLRQGQHTEIHRKKHETRRLSPSKTAWFAEIDWVSKIEILMKSTLDGDRVAFVQARQMH